MDYVCATKMARDLRRKGYGRADPCTRNSQPDNPWGLDNPQSRSKIPEIPGKPATHPMYRGASGFMTTKSTPSAQSANVQQPCKHPRVQIVSRDEESEFVECKECGEIFESSEFKDMNIEDSKDESEL
jgi:hypothetical protein